MTTTANAVVPDAERAALPERWRRRVAPLALGVVLAGFLGALTYVNCVWSCYPYDNDLDEVGWMAQHLSLARPESLANQGYPPGLPVVLRLLTPLVGSFLRAAFLWQALAATASVFFVYQITVKLCGHKSGGALALVSAALAGLPVFTSEFADGTSTAIFLGGVWALARREGDRRGLFLLGAASGLAYLFRTHYTILIAIVPVAMVMAGFGWRAVPKLALAFAAGFAATAWPLWLLNMLAYGTPLHAGVSQYNIAFSFIPGAFNWEDYPNTYQRWPLSRILDERPVELLKHSLGQLYGTLARNLVVAAGALGTAALVLVRDQARRRLLAFAGLVALGYVLLVITPTRFTDRAFAPVAMLCSVLVGSGAALLLQQTKRPFWYLPFMFAGVLLINFPSGQWDTLKNKAREARYNTRLTRILVSNGMQSSGEVFSNIWDMYNMADPNFVTFYNYGGWIELDSEYRRERPHPTAVSVAEWQAFFAEHGIRFAILRQRPQTAEVFKAPPSTWKELFSDRKLTIWAIDPPPSS